VLALRAVRIAFDGLWLPVFFGLRNIRLGMVVVSALWIFVAFRVLVFWLVDRIAALLFLP
jgi:tryptophan-rich sensory protein